MNGILLLNKDQGFSSQQVLTKVKRLINANKVGHAGTLDPIATGLLIVLVNGATKLSDYLMMETKEYIAEIFIGKSTDTYDSTGIITEEKLITDLPDVDLVLKSFLGKSYQIPPMYSAIKMQGKKLYELARSGMMIEREKREIEIFEIERISDIEFFSGFAKFKFRVVCSKGTYIRSLCLDIGKKLGYPAHMTSLIRTKVGTFSLTDAYSIKDLENGNYKLIKMQDALKHYYKEVKVDSTLAKLVFNGVAIDQKVLKENADYILLTYHDELIGIYKKDQGKYKAERVWNY